MAKLEEETLKQEEAARERNQNDVSYTQTQRFLIFYS